jgi:hypothetical protein
MSSDHCARHAPDSGQTTSSNKEFFRNYLPILYLVHAQLSHFHAPLSFHGKVHRAFKSDGVIDHQRLRYFNAVHIFNHSLKLAAFLYDGIKANGFFFKFRGSIRLHTFNIRGIKRFLGPFKITLPAVIHQQVCNFLCCHLRFFYCVLNNSCQARFQPEPGMFITFFLTKQSLYLLQ